MGDLVNISKPNSVLRIERQTEQKQSSLHRLRVRTAQTIIYFQTKFSEKNEITIER